MGAEQIRIRPPRLNGDSGDAKLWTARMAGNRPTQTLTARSFPALRSPWACLTYVCFLAWESWRELSHFMANPASTGVAIVIMAIQMVSPLLPGLAYAVTYLSWRRSPPWFLSAGTLCLTGLVTAAIEMFVYANR